MTNEDRWWIVKERPFHSDLPLVGPAVAWFRRRWNSVSTRWYVLAILEQQNAINARLVDLLSEVRQELTVGQQTTVSLDEEQQGLRRDLAGAIYTLADEVQQLTARVQDLESRMVSKD